MLAKEEETQGIPGIEERWILIEGIAVRYAAGINQLCCEQVEPFVGIEREILRHRHESGRYKCKGCPNQSGKGPGIIDKKCMASL